MSKFSLKLAAIRLFLIYAISMVIMMAAGSVIYMANEIRNANWTKVSFFGCVTIFIVLKLNIITQDLINILIDPSRFANSEGTA
jgi:hypothetical protein